MPLESGQSDLLVVKALQTMNQHWSVGLSEDIRPDFYLERGGYADEM